MGPSPCDCARSSGETTLHAATLPQSAFCHWCVAKADTRDKPNRGETPQIKDQEDRDVCSQESSPTHQERAE